MRRAYLDNDADVTRWLERLVESGNLPKGEVFPADIRYIEFNVKVAEKFSRIHWFAGIGGWALAEAMSSIPDDIPLWTASMPCQPWSVAGPQKGFQDERHVAPYFLEIVDAAKPPLIVGEQVSSGAGLRWVDHLSDEMEGRSYTFWAAVLAASSVGAPHIRRRIYWAAWLPDSNSLKRTLEADLKRRRKTEGSELGGDRRKTSRLSNTNSKAANLPQRQAGSRWADSCREIWGTEHVAAVLFRDGKVRPVPNRLCEVAHGIPKGMVGKLRRWYGNAIVPQLGALWIDAVLDAIAKIMEAS